MLLVVVESTGAHLCAHVGAADVPYLYLGCATQIDACIRLLAIGVELPIDGHLKVAVGLLRAEVVEAVALIYEQSILHLPVGSHNVIGLLLLLLELVGAHLCTGDGVVHQSLPA